MTHLKPGDKAPNFSAKDQNGKIVSLADFAGKKLILYFYPKDLTPGCTTQACNFRDNASLLKETGDWVHAGDTLATVGDSGGQNETGLYFELRHDSKPLNPKTWLKK